MDYHTSKLLYFMEEADELRQSCNPFAFVEQGLEQGISRGELIIRKKMLVRLLGKKFTLTGQEEAHIEACDDPAKLDSALEAILDAGRKEEVLDELE